MRLFFEPYVSDYLNDRLTRMRDEIQKQDRDYVLGVDDTQFTAYLVGRYRIDPLVLDWDGLTISDRVEKISAERFPNTFTYNVRRGGSYPKQVLTCHLPFSGDKELLRHRPQSHYDWTTDAKIEGNCVCFDVVNWDENPENISEQSAERIRSELAKIREYVDYDVRNANSEVEHFNKRLEAEAASVFRARKDSLLKQANLVRALGIPLKKSPGVPQTFAVPVVKRPLSVERPKSAQGRFTPDPAIDMEVYEEILRITYELGVEMERHPSLYLGKGEETLRDHLLLMLSPHFQSTTGEAFNREGKTDILVRHENHNAFVAECKFWSGAKGFHKTIDQLLSYLTWRDSKAAAVIFVPNAEIQPVLSTIEAEASRHGCYVKALGKRRDGWFMYRFRLPDDPSRGLDLAVLVFHFPKNAA